MIHIQIDTSNAAFEGDAYIDEVTRILRNIVERLDDGYWDLDRPLYDVNGNRVGEMRSTKGRARAKP